MPNMTQYDDLVYDWWTWYLIINREVHMIYVLEKISKIWSTLRSLNFKGASKSQMLKTRKSFSVTGLPTYKIWSLEFMSHTTGTFLTGPFSKEELRITGCKWVMHDLILNSLSNNILKLQIYFVDVFVESMCQLKYQLKIIRGRITIKKNSVHAWTYKYWERETLMDKSSRRQFSVDVGVSSCGCWCR